MAEGQITGKQIIDESGLNWGIEYAKNVREAVKAEKQLIELAEKFNDLKNKFSNVKNTDDFEKTAREHKKATDQANISLKERDRIQKKLLLLEERLSQVNSQNNKKIIEKSVAINKTNSSLRQQAKTSSALNKVYLQLNQKYQKLNKLAQEAGAIHGTTSKEFKKASREALKYRNRLDKIDDTLKNSQRNVGRYNTALGGSFKLLRQLSGALGIYAGVGAFREIYQEVKELDSLNKALEKVTSSAEEYATIKQFLRRTSEAYGVEIKSNTKEFTKFLAGLKGTNLEGEKGIAIYEKTVKASSALGRSQDELQGTLNALTQIISKGTVQAEELRGQLGDRLPGAFNIMARAIGVSTEELNDMLKNGEVLAEDVLPKFADELEKTFGIENLERVETLEASTNRLSNSFTQLIENLEGGESRVSKFFIFITDSLAKIVEGFAFLAQSAKEWGIELSKSLESQKFTEEQQYIREEAEKTGKTLEEIALSRKGYSNEILLDSKRQLKALEKIFGSYEKLSEKLDKKQLGANEDKSLYIDAQKKFESLKRQISSYTGIVNAINSFLPKTTSNNDDEKPKDEPKELTEAEKKAIQRRLEQRKKLEFEYSRLILQQKQINLEDELKSEELSLEEKLKIAEKLYKTKVELSYLTTKKSLVAVKEGSQKEKNAIQDYKNDIIKLEQAYSAQKEQIVKDEFKKRLDAVKAGREAEEKAVADAILKEAKKLEKNNQGATDKERLENIQAYEDAVVKIKQDSAKKQIEIEIKRLEGLKAGATPEQILLIDKQISDAKIALSNIETDKILNNIDRQIDAEKKLHEFRLQFISEISGKLADTLDIDAQNLETFINKAIDGFTKGFKHFTKDVEGVQSLLIGLEATAGVVADVGNYVFQQNIDRIDEEIEANSRKHDEALEKAQDRYDSEGNLLENRENQRKLIEASKKKEEKKLQEEKKREQIKQFKFEKALAITKAGIAMALAILNAAQTQPYFPLGLAMTVAAGILGTIQIAAIASAPVPKFRYGTKRPLLKDTLAITGDGGEHEPITMGNQLIGVSPKTDTLTLLPKGAEVHSSWDSLAEKLSNDEMMEMLHRASFETSLNIDRKQLNDIQARKQFNIDYEKWGQATARHLEPLFRNNRPTNPPTAEESANALADVLEDKEFLFVRGL